MYFNYIIVGVQNAESLSELQHLRLASYVLRFATYYNLKNVSFAIYDKRPASYVGHSEFSNSTFSKIKQKIEKFYCVYIFLLFIITLCPLLHVIRSLYIKNNFFCFLNGSNSLYKRNIMKIILFSKYKL